MSYDYVVFALISGLIGWVVNEYFNSRQRKRADKELRRAITSLRKKGFDVTLDRLAGFDVETQREMEIARSAGYTVTQSGKSITLSKQP